MTSKQTQPLPYPFYFYSILVLVLTGIADTIYLAYSHYKNYTDLEYSSFCAISKAVNCDTVSQSPWSIFITVPISYWGLLGYLLLLVILVQLRKKDTNQLSLWHAIFWLSLVFSIISLILAYISATKIQSYCIMCLLSYGINFSLLLVSWITSRRFLTNTIFTGIPDALTAIKTNSILKMCIALLCSCFLLLLTFFPAYWTFEYPVADSTVSTGKTDDGHPWIGAANPLLIIEEFSDYQCFQCSKMHFFLRTLINEYPEKIRLVHRNYPMDHEYNPVVVPEPFHVGSGKMALIAIQASTFGKFWQINDALYQFASQKKSFSLQALSESTGVSIALLAPAFTNKFTNDMLKSDIWHGMKHEISGTPTFIINGTPYVGTIPPDILRPVLN